MLEGWKELGDIFPKYGDVCEIKTASGEFYYEAIYDEDDDGGFFELESINKTIPTTEVTHLKIKPSVNTD